MASDSSGPTGLRVTRMKLFELLSEIQLLAKANIVTTRETMLNYVMLRMPGFSEERIRSEISWFSINILRLWKESGRKKAYFLSRNTDWLQKEICSSMITEQDVTVTPTQLAAHLSRADFSTASKATKNRRTKILVTENSPEELFFAAQSSLTKQGKRNVAAAIKQAASSSPRSVWSIKRLKLHEGSVRPYTAQEALALIINAKLNVSQYKNITREAKERNCDLYPSYEKIQIAKKKCYPENLTFHEVKGEVKLQSLLDHSVQRLAKVQSEVISRVVKENDNVRMEIMYKWGFDGSASHSTYKQKFFENTDATDSHMLLTAIVPLQMTAKIENAKEVVWQNHRSSSTRFCMPIRIQFIKESHDIIKKESEYIERQISTLMPTKIDIDGQDFSVHHVLINTMMDGKVANSLADNRSSQTCYICGATPNQMNDLDAVVKRQCNTNTFGYGLSPLHAYIRLFECILHISHRKEKETWRVAAADKIAVNDKKSDVIEAFRQRTGLLVDVVKQGSGNTNDGNTARRFFKETKTSSEITGVDERLIIRLSVILQTITCGDILEIESFRRYALDTARLFVNLYHWYKMPARVHKILIHSADVMGSLSLPIGQLSEEALEARHKECRYYREHHTRKIGRKQTMEDLLRALLISSDIVISSEKPLRKRKASKLDKDVIQLVKSPETPVQNRTMDDDSTSK